MSTELWAQTFGTANPNKALDAYATGKQQTGSPGGGAPQAPAAAGADASQMNTASPGTHNGNPAIGYQDPWYVKPHQTQGQMASAASQGLLTNEPQPGDPNYQAYYSQNPLVGNPGMQSGGNINAGAPGYMPAGFGGGFTLAQQGGTSQFPNGGVDPYAGMGRAAPSIQDDPAFSAALANLLGGGGSVRAPNAFSGPGGAPTVGQGAQSLRQDMGMGAYGQAPGQTVPPPLTTSPAAGAVAPAVQPQVQPQVQTQAAGPGKVATDAQATGAQQEVPAWTWEGNTTRKGWHKKGLSDPDPAWTPPQGASTWVSTGGYEGDIEVLGDPGIQSMLDHYNRLASQLDDPGTTAAKLNELRGYLTELGQGLQQFGFQVQALGDQPPAAPPGGGGEVPPGYDLGPGLPTLGQAQLPTFFRNLFNIDGQQGTGAATAAWEAFLNAWREDRGAQQQQLAVNELMRTMQGLEGDPLRTQARDQALELAAMGDPTNYDIIRNQTAGDYADALNRSMQGFGRAAALAGLGTGSNLGQAYMQQAAMGRDLANRMGDIQMLQDRGAYDYGLRGIDALTNTFAATQNPVTQASMMLAQAMLGQAPYGGSFGGGTGLFNMGTGLDAINIARGAADDAGDRPFDWGGLFGNLGQAAMGAKAAGVF
jgi:hypothetical protein